MENSKMMMTMIRVKIWSYRPDRTRMLRSWMIAIFGYFIDTSTLLMRDSNKPVLKSSADSVKRKVFVYFFLFFIYG